MEREGCSVRGWRHEVDRLKRIRRVRLVALSMALLSSAVQCWCIDSAHAQQAPTARRIAVVLVATSPQGSAAQAFLEGLRDAGYTEGRDVVLDWRSAKGDYAQLPAMLVDVVRTEPDIIVVESTIAMGAAKQATVDSTIQRNTFILMLHFREGGVYGSNGTSRSV